MTVATEWYIQMFGSLQLHVGDVTIKTDQWVSKKAVALLEFLLTRSDQQASRDVLLSTLWPDEDRDSARGRLHSTVYFLRQALEPYANDASVIRYVAGTYSFQPTATCTYDTERFEAAYEQAVAAEADDAMAANELYLQAIALYSGPYLAHQPLQPWLAVQRSHYHDMYVQAVVKAAAFSADNGDTIEALRVLRLGLTHDPLHEPLHQAFIQTLLAVGRYAEASQHFRMFCKQMEDAYGVAPSPGFMRLMSGVANEVDATSMSPQHRAAVVDSASFQHKVSAASRRYQAAGETASVVHVIFPNSVVVSRQRELTRMLSRHVRRGDSVSWLTASELGILLPRTNARKGPAIRDRVQRLLSQARIAGMTVQALPIQKFVHGNRPRYYQSVSRTS